MNTIIHTHGGGRFCDQSVTFCHLAAFAEEYRPRVTIISADLWPFSQFIEDESIRLFGCYPSPPEAATARTLLRVLRTNRLRAGWVSHVVDRAAEVGFHGLAHVAPRARSAIARRSWIHRGVIGTDYPLLDLATRDGRNALLDRRLTMLAGQFITAYPLVRKHRRILQKRLVPRAAFQQNAERFIEGLRRTYDFLVGVMVRQRDYRTWSDGRFFFETPEYVEWMRQTAERFRDRGRTAFVIASDEPQDPSHYAGIEAVFCTGFAVGEGHYLENLMELSMCDLVLTPPSSFGLWAAFLGDKPVLPVGCHGQRIETTEVLTDPFFEAASHPYLSQCIH